MQQLTASTAAAFEEVHRKSFLEDPSCNPTLAVEVVEAAMVADIPTLILITPRKLLGLMFLPESTVLSELVVGRRRFPVLGNTLEGLGTYSSVDLVPDVGGFADRADARHAAAALAEPFREAVARALEEESVANPQRRDLFKRLAGGESGPTGRS